MASEGLFWEYEHSIMTNWTTLEIHSLRWIYDLYIMGATKPPEEQFQRHFEIGSAFLRGEGYTDREIKWWFLRTGQGPACYRQMQIGVPCGLPPYEVWRDWYWHIYVSPYGTNYGSVDPATGIVYQPLVANIKIYPPPGYSMPGMPCNTSGKNITGYDDQAYWNYVNKTGPWPYTDVPELTGDPALASGMFTAFDSLGAVNLAFCTDATEGFLHPVPMCYTVFLPSSLK